MSRRWATFPILALAGMTLMGVAVGGDFNETPHLAPIIQPNSSGNADTLRLLIRDAEMPNTIAAAADSGEGWIQEDPYYDIILDDSGDGAHFRWGCVATSDKDNPYYHLLGPVTRRAVEDNQSEPPLYLTFLWFDTSAIPDGYRIESANIFVNVQKFNTDFDLTTGSVNARADTNAADYAMLASESTNADANFFWTSWNHVDKSHAIAWSPPLDERDDWHDYGPRGVPYAPGEVLSEGHSLRIDVTGPVQQVVDKGEQGRGLIFVLYLVGTPAGNETYMVGLDSNKAPFGNPSLAVVATSERGELPWNGIRVPVSMVFDDNKFHDFYFFAILDSLGEKFSTASYRDSWDANADHLWTANDEEDFDFILHTVTHQRLAPLDSAELDFQLSREWMVTTITDPPDTVGLTNFAWVGGGFPRFSYLAIERLMANGYKTARATTYDPDSDIGELTFASWDQYVNLYAVQSQLASLYFLNVTDRARFVDGFFDYIDICYTDHGRAAAMLYTHGFDDADLQAFRWMFEVIDATEGLEFVSHGWIMDQLTSRDFVAPGDITVANGATASIALSAARYDSIATATGVSWPNRVWVEPKRGGGSVSSVGNEGRIDDLPTSRSLVSYPNPFNPRTRIMFSLEAGQHVRLKIYNIAGRLVRVLVDEPRTEGLHTEVWDGRDSKGIEAAAGPYLIRLETQDEITARKIMLLK